MTISNTKGPVRIDYDVNPVKLLLILVLESIVMI
jgi:hypothetical protein